MKSVHVPSIIIRNPVLPAETQRWQQKDHEDKKRVALVHGGPVFSRTKRKKIYKM